MRFLRMTIFRFTQRRRTVMVGGATGGATWTIGATGGATVVIGGFSEEQAASAKAERSPAAPSDQRVETERM